VSFQPIHTVHLLALSSALLSAASTIFIRQGLRGGGTFGGFWVNLAVGTAGLWAAVLLTGGVGRLTAAGAVLFVLAGLIGTVAGRLLRFVSIEKVGASIAAALNNLHPIFATALAILLLGERVSLPILGGTVVIVIGTILLSEGGRRIGFRWWQLAVPVLSAACFGLVAIVRKLGLSETGAVPGSAINVTTALIAFTVLLGAFRRIGDVLACRGWSLAWFIAAGVAENTAVFLNVMALSLGSVSVVAPLLGTGPIFVLLLSSVFLRGLETLSGRVILGTVLIVLGVYVITALSGP
jgi:DME family drug/metabolite transporter